MPANKIHTLKWFWMLLFFGGVLLPLQSLALTPVRVQFNWAHQFEYAGFYIAKEKGFYREAGLDVTLSSLKESGYSPEQALDAGKADFIVSTTPALAAALKGKPWVMVANYFKRSALVWLVQPEIRSPRDLVNKPVGITPGKQQGSVLTALLSLYDVQPYWVQMAPQDMLEAFRRNKIAAMPAYMTNEPIRLMLAKEKYGLLEPWRFGLEGLGDSVFAQRAFVESHPALTRAFVRATSRGWAYALAHPDEAIALIKAKYDELNKSLEALKLEAHLTRLLIMPELYPIGSISKQVLHRVSETLVVAGLVESMAGLELVIWDSYARVHHTAEEITFCNDPTWVPIDYVDKFGHPKGIAPDFVQDMFTRFLPQYQLKYYPSRTWTEALHNFNSGKCQLLVEAVKTPARAQNMLFSKPYLQYPFLVITRPDHPYVERITQLYGERIARQKNSALIDMLKQKHPDLHIIETQDTDAAFEAVAQGKADAVLAIGPVAQHALLRLGLNNLVINGVLPLTYEIRMAVTPTRPTLLAKINRAIALYPEADLDKLKARYTSVVSRETVNWHWLLGGGAIFVLVLAILWLHSYRSRKAQQQAERQAQQDELTGALNRHGMHLRLPDMLDQQDSMYHLCAIMFDLDHFKQVNDTYGHQVGDQVLKFLVKTVRQHLRNTDLLVRWGGEEFLLFCPGTPPDRAVELAERLRQAVEEGFQKSRWPNVTISIGVTEYRPGDTWAELLDKVDKLLYRAKNRGRNRVETDLTPQKEIKQESEHHADHNH